MIYLGSKRKIAQYIAPIITKDIEKYNAYIEPFVGGANMIQHIPDTIKRIGYDINCNVIEALKLIRDNPKSLPQVVSEYDYKMYKALYKLGEVHGLIGFVGTVCSFGAKFFGGYARNKKCTNYALQGYKNAIKQSPSLKGIEFICSPYDKLEIPKKSIIYCDIPYKGATKYKNKFDYEKFYKWAILKHKEGHKVFISEYSMPEPFKEVWSKEQSVYINGDAKKLRIEKLYTL